jgi:hypothetical protein
MRLANKQDNECEAFKSEVQHEPILKSQLANLKFQISNLRSQISMPDLINDLLRGC